MSRRLCLLVCLVASLGCTAPDESPLFAPAREPMSTAGACLDGCGASGTVGTSAGTPDAVTITPVDTGRSVETVCPADEFRCAGKLLQRCGDDSNAWLDFQYCVSPQLCDETRGANGCLPAVCEAGALRCAGDTLERCRDGSDGTEAVAQCALAGGCDPAALVCRDPCVVGGARCSGALLETCDSVLVGWQSRACASAELCNAETRSCDPPSCAPGEASCRGAQPQRCAPGRTGFVDAGKACASAELCDPSSGACAEPACAVGESACDGLKTLLTCNASQTGFDSAPCNGLLALCNPGPPAACRSLL